MKRQRDCRQWLAAWPWFLLTLLGLLVICSRLCRHQLLGGALHPLAIFTVHNFLQALPYLVLSGVVSTLVLNYLGDAALRQLLPRSRSLSLFSASLLGLAFPVNGSSALVLGERLARQGAPAGPVAAFLLAAPLVNPIVLASTYQAFGGSFAISCLRGGLAWLLAIGVADLVSRVDPAASPLRQLGFYQQPASQRLAYGGQAERSAAGKLLQSACRQIYQSGRCLIIGLLLFSAWQALIPAQWKQAAGLHPWLTIPLLLLVSQLLSVDPAGDAWLVRGLLGQLPGSALIGWLLLAPVVSRRQIRSLFSRFDSAFAKRLLGAGLAAALLISLLAQLAGIGAWPARESGVAAAWRPVRRSVAAGQPNPPAPPPDGTLKIETGNFLAMMELLWFGSEEIGGRAVEMSGFVYSDPTLGPEDFVLARRLQTADSPEPVVAGLLCRWPQRDRLLDGQWLLVQGKLGRLSYYDLGAGRLASMPFIQAEQLTEIEPPPDATVKPEWR